MRRLVVFVLVLAAFAVAGCGGGGGGGGGSEGAANTTGGTVTGSGKTLEVDDGLIFAITSCLDAANYNVQPSGNQVIGTSERGVLYLIKFFPTIDAAKAKAAKGDLVIDNALVKFNVKGFQNAGGVNTAVKPTTEPTTIRDCIESSA